MAPVAPIGMGDGPPSTLTTFSGRPSLLRDRNRDDRKRFVDFDALEVVETPASPFEHLTHRRNGTEPEHSGFDGSNAEGHEAGQRLDAIGLGKCALATTIAAAALLSPGALPAVVVPFGRNAGLRVVSTDIVVWGRGALSRSKDSTPLRPLTATGAISATNTA